MTRLIDLTPRFVSAFGIAPQVHTVQPIPGGQYLPYTAGAKVYVKGNGQFETIGLTGGSKERGDTYDITFGSAGLTKSGELGAIFAPPPMLGFTKSKNIIVTPIDGADAEVVERYGDGPWEIRMQGLLVDMENHRFPLDRLGQLRKMFEVPDYCEVTSQIINELGITHIYFAECDITPLQGFEDTCSFSLVARAMKPAEFYLNNENQ